MYPQVFGKYVLERELARGGMARVVLATLRGAGGFEKKLVVKQIREELACDDDFVRRFVEEAKTTVALSHPNIVPVYELGVERGTYFLAMEFVEGASLAELLRASTQPTTDGGARVGLSPDEAAYVGVEVCRALDYAHRRMNVVHRDVTPRNVMVDEEGQVKVIDFGIAAPITSSSGSRRTSASLGFGCGARIASSIASFVCRRKVALPLQSSISKTATAKTSAAGVSSLASICSGGMCPGDPNTPWPLGAVATGAAMPKSMTLT